MNIIQIETAIDLTDLMDQVFRFADQKVLLDLMLNSIEEDSDTKIHGTFPTECRKLTKQINERVEDFLGERWVEEEDEEEEE